MSTTTLRHHSSTLSFLPTLRARRIESARRNARILFSQRRFKRMTRNLFVPREV